MLDWAYILSVASFLDLLAWLSAKLTGHKSETSKPCYYQQDEVTSSILQKDDTVSHATWRERIYQFFPSTIQLKSVIVVPCQQRVISLTNSITNGLTGLKEYVYSVSPTFWPKRICQSLPSMDHLKSMILVPCQQKVISLKNDITSGVKECLHSVSPASCNWSKRIYQSIPSTDHVKSVALVPYQKAAIWMDYVCSGLTRIKLYMILAIKNIFVSVCNIIRQAVVSLILPLVMCLLYCCPCYWVYRCLRGSREPAVSSESDQPNAIDAINNFLDTKKNRKKYREPVEMNCLGSRLHKYWYQAQVDGSGEERVVMTAAVVSKNCHLKLNPGTLREIDELLTTLNPHPLVHRILEVSYDRNFQHVIIVQEYITQGSLKDMIYNMTTADSDWSEKYCKRSKGLPTSTVALYGRQILEAMMYLYRHGFPYHQLGHVHSGNVFVANDVCRLGGYENTLVGYRTRLFRLCRHHEDRIDIVMFGHLLFEMCCGYELTTCTPRRREYATVKDKLMKSTLKFIFEKGFPHSIEEISNTKCFKDQEIPTSMDRTLSLTCQSLLEKVRSNPPQEQDPPDMVRKQPSSIVRPST